MYQRALKVTAFIVAIVFSLSSVSFAAGANVYSIKIPEEYGSVVQRYKAPAKKDHRQKTRDYRPLSGAQGASNEDKSMVDGLRSLVSDKTVILIQDAHANFEAQKNLSHILQYLSAEGSVSTEHPGFSTHPVIGVEGAVGLVDSDRFRRFPLAEVRQEVGEEFVKTGVFTGAELAAVSMPQKMSLWGVEDKELFLKNFRAFYAVSLKQDELMGYVDGIEECLAELRTKVFNEDLREFEAKAQIYKNNPEVMLNFLAVLYHQMDALGIDSFDYMQLFQFKEAFIVEQTIDYDSLEMEIERLHEALIAYEEKNEDAYDAQTDVFCREIVTNRFRSYQQKQLTQREIVSYFSSIALRCGVSLEPYFNVQRAMQYWRKYALCDMSKLIDEIHEVTQKVCLLYARSDAERSLVSLIADMFVLKQLLTLQATKSDVDTFHASPPTYTFTSIISRIKRIILSCLEPGGSTLGSDVERLGEMIDSLRTAQPVVDDALACADTFYAVAEARDKIMVANLLAQMKREEKQTGVLVAGGYHSEGVVSELQKQGISYVTVMPQISDRANDSGYMARMMGQVAPLSPHLSAGFSASMLNAFLQEIAEKDEVKRLSLLFSDRNLNTFFKDITVQYGRTDLSADFVLAAVGSEYENFARFFFEEGKRKLDGWSIDDAYGLDQAALWGKAFAEILLRDAGPASIPAPQPVRDRIRGLRPIRPPPKSPDVLRATAYEMIEYAEALHVYLEDFRSSVFKDKLTGLLNRAGYEDALAEVINYVQHHGVVGNDLQYVIFDIDNFGAVNNLFGHAVGDEVLQNLGDVVRSSVRKSDKAARYGGEEIVILMPGVSLDDAELRIRQLSKKMLQEKPIAVTGPVQRNMQGYLDGLVRAIEEKGSASVLKDCDKIKSSLLHQMRIQGIVDIDGVSYEYLDSLASPDFITAICTKGREGKLYEYLKFWKVSLSAGVVAFEENMRPKDFARSADVALLAAKDTKGGRTFEDPLKDNVKRYTVTLEKELDVEGEPVPFKFSDVYVEDAPVSPLGSSRREWLDYSLSLEEQVAVLQDLAVRDPLTGLFNRAAYDESVVAYVEDLYRHPGRSIQYMLMDIDHFGAVNDVFGHEVGDAVLTEMGRAMRASLRRYDLAARYGGEELVFLLQDASAEIAQKRAVVINQIVQNAVRDFFDLSVLKQYLENLQVDPDIDHSKVRSAVIHQIAVQGLDKKLGPVNWAEMSKSEFATYVLSLINEGTLSKWVITVSSGISLLQNEDNEMSFELDAFYKKVNETVDSLKKQADAALYRAKERGRNRAVVYTEVRQESADFTGTDDLWLLDERVNNVVSKIGKQRFMSLKDEAIVLSNKFLAGYAQLKGVDTVFVDSTELRNDAMLSVPLRVIYERGMLKEVVVNKEKINGLLSGLKGEDQQRRALQILFFHEAAEVMVSQNTYVLAAVSSAYPDSAKMQGAVLHMLSVMMEQEQFMNDNAYADVYAYIIGELEYEPLDVLKVDDQIDAIIQRNFPDMSEAISPNEARVVFEGVFRAYVREIAKEQGDHDGATRAALVSDVSVNDVISTELKDYFSADAVFEPLQTALAERIILEDRLTDARSLELACQSVTGINQYQEAKALREIKDGGSVFSVGVDPELMDSLLYQATLAKIFAEAEESGLQLTVEAYNTEKTYALVLSQDAFVQHIAAKQENVVVFSNISDVKSLSVEITLFSQVLFRVLQHVKNKAFELIAEEIDCFMLVEGRLVFASDSVRNALQNKVIQQVYENVIRMAA